MNKKTNDYYQKCFWNKLQQIKFEIIYYNLHMAECVKISRLIKIISICLTVLSTSLLLGFYNILTIRIVCAIIIVIVPIFNALSENLPYEKRAIELREMSVEYNRVYNVMETDWRKIANGEISYGDINLLIQDYDIKFSEIDAHYFKNDALPDNKKVEEKANQKAEDYFKNLV